MGNKLKDIFSSKMIDLGGNIRFDNPGAHKKFLEALKIVEEEGRVVEVEGLSSISTKVTSGNYEYPFSKADRVDKVYVGPSTVQVPIILQTEMGERTLQLSRYHTTREIILETNKRAIVYLRLSIKKESSQNTFSYRAQPELAKTIEEIIESYSIIEAFLNYLFRDDIHTPQQEYEMIANMKKYFNDAIAYFKRARKIEETFKIQFNPAKQNEKGNDEQELEELYLLIFENKVFRYNAELSGTGDAQIAMKEQDVRLAIGKKVEMSFSGTAEFNIYGETISIYTANLLANAIIRQVKEEMDGKTKIWYGDTDSEPMFISYMGFKTLDEREEELKKMMDHKKKYLDAVTIEEYLIKKYA